jgi:hypothetical protein
MITNSVKDDAIKNAISLNKTLESVKNRELAGQTIAITAAFKSLDFGNDGKQEQRRIMTFAILFDMILEDQKNKYNDHSLKLVEKLVQTNDISYNINEDGQMVFANNETIESIGDKFKKNPTENEKFYHDKLDRPILLIKNFGNFRSDYQNKINEHKKDPNIEIKNEIKALEKLIKEKNTNLNNTLGETFKKIKLKADHAEKQCIEGIKIINDAISNSTVDLSGEKLKLEKLELKGCLDSDHPKDRLEYLKNKAQSLESQSTDKKVITRNANQFESKFQEVLGIASSVQKKTSDKKLEEFLDKNRIHNVSR